MPDGESLLCQDDEGKKLAILPLSHPGQFRTISEVPYQRRSFRLSPDGRSVAYESEESHGTQVVVAAFPSFNEKRQVSVGGGSTPVWRPDGKGLFFLASDWTLMSVNVETGNKIKAGFRVLSSNFPSIRTALTTRCPRTASEYSCWTILRPRPTLRSMCWSTGRRN